MLVTDEAGPLSLAGVMGGLESEVTETTQNVLLEGASWNYINTRRTVSAQSSSLKRLPLPRAVPPWRNSVCACLERIANGAAGRLPPGW